MIWRVDVFAKKETSISALNQALRDAGICESVKIYNRKVYFIDGELTKQKIIKIILALLVDPITENYTLTKGLFARKPKDNEIVIALKPGVCDSVALSLEKAIRDLKIKINSCRTGQYYCFDRLDQKTIYQIAAKLFFNPIIEYILDYSKNAAIKTLNEFDGQRYNFKLIIVDILSADDNRLQDISRQGCLSLNLDEMRIIRDYFKKLNRNPTDCELETIAVLWSEHCCHKTFRSIIDYQEQDKNGKILASEQIDNLIKSTIFKATDEINHQDCVSVFKDNAGVVKFDEKNNICFKVETHNHPSSLEPYGGASTGIGGVIRDILGTGCAAKPFASTDVFCFAPWNIGYKNLPQGLLHPKRIIQGVIGGVRDYGNRMGIPTVNGAVYFDSRFLSNPLVYCGTLGIMPQEKSFKIVKPGDLVILAGAKTGRDGIHGATFSSKELDEQTVGLTSAVQIGNAIEEKKLLEAILRARDKNLFTAITDCGAGGISSAITELGGEYGVEIDLDKVPLKYKGLSYTEIWISESQERMVFFTQEEHLAELKKIFNEEDAGMTVIGKVTGRKKLELNYQNNKVCELNLTLLFELPKLSKKAVWIDACEERIELEEKKDYTVDLKKLLASPNIACKDWVLRQYDHEVQAGSVHKGIYGIAQEIVSDAAVCRPDLTSDKCVIISCGINPAYSDIDSYWTAGLAIDEALRNLTACGGRIDKTFILDNFCWGSPQDPAVLASLVRAAKACYDFAVYYGVPFISGKDSLYNEYNVGNKRIAIPGTILISAMCVADNWRKIIGNNFHKDGNLIYLLGLTKPELGAGEYFRLHNAVGGLVPKIDRETAKPIFEKLSAAIALGIVESCHDLSEGGLAVALAEMVIGSNLGASVFLGEVPRDYDMNIDEILFSESPTRFVVEVTKANKDMFEKALQGMPLGLIGCVKKEPELIIAGMDGGVVISADKKILNNAWTKTFKDFRYKPVQHK